MPVYRMNLSSATVFNIRRCVVFIAEKDKGDQIKVFKSKLQDSKIMNYKRFYNSL